MASGWFSDPLGRHEKRFFSGLVWTDRVMDGDHSGSDPIGNGAPQVRLGPVKSTEASGFVDQPNGGNLAAVSALMLGIVGAVIALVVPFGFLVGAACGLVAVALGLRAYRTAPRRDPASSALARTALVLGCVALIVAAYYGAGYYSVASTVRRAFASSSSTLTVAADPLRNNVHISDCYRFPGAGSPAATGTLVNTAAKKQSFRVTIDFTIGAIKVRSDTTTVPLAAGASGSWTVRDIDHSFKPASCVVVTPVVSKP